MPSAQYQETVLAESGATEKVEGNVYFPRESVNMDLFRPSPTQYTCSWKGEAEYFHLELNGETLADAAWSYPDPKDAAKAIAGHLAFDKRKGIAVSG